MRTTGESVRGRGRIATAPVQPHSVRLTPSTTHVSSSLRARHARFYPHDDRATPRDVMASTCGTRDLTPRTVSARRGRSDLYQRQVDTRSGDTAAFFASTLPIMARGLRSTWSADPFTSPSRALPAAHETTSTREYDARHHTLLAEERDQHRRSLDREWQQRQAAEAAVMKLEAQAQIRRWETRLEMLRMSEALARSELARTELEARLEAERAFHLCAWIASAGNSTCKTPVVAAAASPLDASQHAFSTLVDVVVAPTSSQASCASRPPDVRARSGKKAAAATSSSTTRPPRAARADATATAAGATSPARPLTGLVRDSDLLRHLREAEARIRQLERCLTESRAGRDSHAVTDVPYAAVSATLVVLDAEAEVDDVVGMPR